MFGYSGWSAATYVAEELREPQRTLPRALIVGTGAIALMYLALNIVFIFGTPLETMKGVVPWVRWRPRRCSVHKWPVCSVR
jgi:APA family basic amino acid/polyamine antiporter